MKTYLFGGAKYGEDSWMVDSPSLRRAILTFRAVVMFPHLYSTAPAIERHGDLKAARASAPGARVLVHEKRFGEAPNAWTAAPWKWEVVAEIDPEADDDLLRLPSGVADQLEEAPSALAPLAGMTRHEAENTAIDLSAKLQELEAMKRSLRDQLEEIRKEMQRRVEKIWLIELFLGSHESVHQLLDGSPAGAGDRIHVRQRVMCMDEEMSVWQFLYCPEKLGKFETQKMEDFDEWVRDPEHLYAIAPWPKCIVGLRPRRKDKDRAEPDLASALLNARLEAEDRHTYILIRNGDRLYRIWADISLWPRFFPADDEWKSRVDPEDHWREHAERNEAADASRRAKLYYGGLILLQGLVERSDLLAPLPPGVNVLEPASVAEHFVLIRDAEAVALTDGSSGALQRLTWRSVKKWMREQLAPGQRVLYRKGRFEAEDKLYNRTWIKSLYSWPANGLYTICHDERADRWSFMYLPYQDEWEPARKRRVSFRTYEDEVFPVDLLSPRLVRHLVTDLASREDYATFMPLLVAWSNVMRKEQQLEAPFLDLALRQAGGDLESPQDRARIARLLRWWKMRTQVHRAVMTDDAKALRMIVKAFRAGNDVDNDPDKDLP